MNKRAASKKPASRSRKAAGPRKPAAPKNPDAGERIAKRMARAGLCSRREAERWIEAGRVTLNGKKITSPAVAVTAKDRITVDGKALDKAEPTRLWRYHKKPGQMTTHADPQGRPTVFENLPSELPRVISVGRLDFNTEGLLLLTNDGELARYLELPSTAWVRRYRVRVHGAVPAGMLDELKKGVTVEGVRYGPAEAVLDSQKGSNSWLTISIREGKNREIRNLLRHFNLQVTRLIRTSYGPFQLGELAAGEAAAVPRRVLRDQLGEKAGDFGLSTEVLRADRRG